MTARIDRPVKRTLKWTGVNSLQGYDRIPMAADDLLGQFPHLGPLPDGVRRAHAPPLVARGRFKIVSKPIARLWGLPKSGDEVDTEVRVTVEDGVQIWRRRFGGQGVETRQWVEDGLLIEAKGAGRVGMRLEVRDSVLHYKAVKGWIGPFRTLWYPRVEAEVAEVESGWSVSVRVSCSPFGVICRYSGILIAT